MPSNTGSIRFAAGSIGLLIASTYPVVGCGDGVGYPIYPKGTQTVSSNNTSVASGGQATGGQTTASTASTRATQGGASTDSTSNATTAIGGTSNNQGGTAAGGVTTNTSTNVTGGSATGGSATGGSATGGSATGGSNTSGSDFGGWGSGGANGSFTGMQPPGNLPQACKDSQPTMEQDLANEVMRLRRSGSCNGSSSPQPPKDLSWNEVLRDNARVQACALAYPSSFPNGVPRADSGYSGVGFPVFVECDASAMTVAGAMKILINGNVTTGEESSCGVLMVPQFRDIGVGFVSNGTEGCWTVVLGQPQFQPH